MTPKELAERLTIQLRTRAEACRKANLHKDAHLHDKAADLIDHLTAPPEGDEVERVARDIEAALCRDGERIVGAIWSSDRGREQMFVAARAALASLSPARNAGFAELLREARTGLSVLLDTAADFTEVDQRNCEQALGLIGRIDAALSPSPAQETGDAE